MRSSSIDLLSESKSLSLSAGIFSPLAARTNGVDSSLTAGTNGNAFSLTAGTNGIASSLTPGTNEIASFTSGTDMIASSDKTEGDLSLQKLRRRHPRREPRRRGRHGSRGGTRLGALPVWSGRNPGEVWLDHGEAGLESTWGCGEAGAESG